MVQGNVDPDEFNVHKPTFEKGARAVLNRRLGKKQMTMVYSDAPQPSSEPPVKNTQTPADKAGRFCLTDPQVLELADFAIKIEKHYSSLHGSWQPMDIEWALDGETNELFIVQARPETAHSGKGKKHVLRNFVLTGKGENIAKGQAVGTAIAQGTARVIKSLSELSKFKDGEILVADTTTPDWEPVMKRAKGIVTNRGGRTCHAAIVARELGIPAVIGCGDATSKVVAGKEVTIDCSKGEVGRVMKGLVEFRVDEWVFALWAQRFLTVLPPP